MSTEEEILLECKNVNIFYGKKQVLHDINLKFPKNKVTAIIGPSGCGKSTLLRCFNRMNDFTEGFKLNGMIKFKNLDIYDKATDVPRLRKNVGMLFQKPNPFPKSIYKNITWGPKINGFKMDYDQLVEKCLKKAALWDEVQDRQHESALELSGGQQQRLCIARTIALNPEFILMDEPCSALDPKSTNKIEALIKELSQKYTIIIVTHNMQQAARISDYCLFLLSGKAVEFRKTEELFNAPKSPKTKNYIEGLFG